MTFTAMVRIMETTFGKTSQFQVETNYSNAWFRPKEKLRN